MGKSYSVNPDDYELTEEVGYGASATVYRAIYLPYNEVVAVKCLDLDRCNSNLDDVRREAQTMSLINHPNVVKAFCSFVVDHNLWVIMPYMAEGSCLHIMKTAYPDGLEESAICSILREALKALEYLHKHGHIHRDVKAGNILIDSSGDIKLADFGVSACLFDKGDRQRSRNTFVGTPCWMAPEVLQPGAGYDFKADIWSFGITALELAHGHAPFSKYPPMKVLLMTIQNAPPGLDYDRDKKFSKSFKEMVAMCLVKDQTKRPTAEKLLKHSFFRNAQPAAHVVKRLFAGLPPLGKRVKELQIKDAAELALKKMPSAEQEALSLSEYKRGVSAWNFDVEDLKLQASSLQEDDYNQEIWEEDKLKYHNDQKVIPKSSIKKDISAKNLENLIAHDFVYRERINDNGIIKLGNEVNKGAVIKEDVVDFGNPLQLDPMKSESKSELPTLVIEKGARQVKDRILRGAHRHTQSGPLIPGAVLSHSLPDEVHNIERGEIEIQPVAEKAQKTRRDFSGLLNLPTRASGNSLSAPIKSSGGFHDSPDEKSKTNLVQIKGRFSVTSENVDLVKDIPLPSVSRLNSQGLPMKKSASIGSWIADLNNVPNSLPSREMRNTNMPASILIPHLQNLFQQTSIQQEIIANLLSSLQPLDLENAPQDGNLPHLPIVPEINGSVDMPFSEREQMLLMKISELEARLNVLVDELTTERLKNMKLQQQVNASSPDEKREADS